MAEADRLYIGRSPCCAGVDQLVVRVPRDAPLGCSVPLQVQTNQQTVSNSVTLAIAEDSGSCSDPTNPFGNGFRDGGRFGAVFLVHTELEMTVDVPEPLEIVADLGIATLREETASPFFFNPLASLPPEGSCTTYTGSGDLWKRDIVALIAPSRRELHAGEELTVSGPRGPRTMVRRLAEPRFYAGVSRCLHPAGLSAALPLLHRRKSFRLSAGWCRRRAVRSESLCASAVELGRA